ncbi:MAG: uncharacterized protein JWR07_5458 [Nevskia sp.]|nr:uncharacterized protein [Nevskia sp.]
MSSEPFYLTRDRMSVKVKLRTEKHGDDDVNAYDVMLYGAFANAVLLKLNPDLRPFLYTQEQSDLLDGQTFNTLRFPELGSLDWTLAMSRMTLVIHDEQDEAESLTLTNRDADKFAFSLLPGGTVNLGLRIKVGEIEDEDDLLKLLRASNQQLLVSLQQAVVAEAMNNFEQAEQITKGPMSDERKAAEKAFNPVGAQTPDEVVGDDDEQEAA